MDLLGKRISDIHNMHGGSEKIITESEKKILKKLRGWLDINKKSVVAIIPARGGSKGFPGKNLFPVLKKPLIQWTLEQSETASNIDFTYVSTDDDQITKLAKNYGVREYDKFKKDLAKDWKKQLKVFEKNPKYPNINNNLCAVYKILANISSKNGKLLEAKKFFEKILTLDPNNLDTAHGYGVLLLKLNQHSKGLNYIRKGTSFIRFAPGDCKII